jgi:hypothetical protein
MFYHFFFRPSTKEQKNSVSLFQEFKESCADDLDPPESTEFKEIKSVDDAINAIILADHKKRSVNKASVEVAFESARAIAGIFQYCNDVSNDGERLTFQEIHQKTGVKRLGLKYCSKLHSFYYFCLEYPALRNSTKSFSWIYNNFSQIKIGLMKEKDEEKDNFWCI